MTDPVVVALLALLLASAVATVAAPTVPAAIVAFGAYSLGMAALWGVFRAPDVALTEAAVGAGVTSALFLVVAVRTGLAERPTTGAPRGGGARSASGVRLPSPDRSSLGAAAAAAGFVAAVLWTVPALPAVGDPIAPGFRTAAPEYVVRAPELGIANVVTAVLVVFRGFDTLGEVAVVLSAAVAVLVAFDREVIR